MNTLYLECKMGAAGDMLMAALYELLTDLQKEEFLEKMNLLLPGEFSVSAEEASSCGIFGTRMHVFAHKTEEGHGAHEHAHHSHDDERHSHDGGHHTYASVLDTIRRLPLSDPVRADASAVYRLIGEAEAAVHRTELEQIHFHEVGTLDALADVVGCCLLFDMIKPHRVLASPIHVGNGTVACAHGILPVPAPATAELLKGIPFYTGGIDSELCTPTGAALLRHFSAGFTAMPVMAVGQTGIGIGTKEFPAANCVRAFLGEEECSADTITDISCNLDDMTGEDLGYCMEALLAEGALEVFFQPIQMKKNRPGILLHCFCVPEEKDRFIRLVLLHTTTRGVRYETLSRATLSASFDTQHTAFGAVRRKTSSGYGITKEKYEFEDLKKIAKEMNLPLAKVRDML